MVNLIIWLVYLPLSILIELFCYITVPFVCLFVKRTLELDVVKRLDKQKVLLPRDNLIYIFKWWSTHDNNSDEWWYGMYNVDHWFAFARSWTQADYDRSCFIRWYCRVMWLWRNCAYGFHYALFSQPKEVAYFTFERGIEDAGLWFKLQLFKHSFQFELQVPLGKRYFSMNIGWKAHKATERLLYANRIISFRTY